MRKYRSLHNLNHQVQQMRQHILLPTLNSKTIQQMNVHHLLSSQNTTNGRQFPQMKLRKNKSLSQLEKSIQKVKHDNLKLKEKLIAITLERKKPKIKTEQATDDRTQIFNKLRKRLMTQKERDAFHLPTEGKTDPSSNKRWHSQGKTQQPQEQKYEQKVKKSKGFNKCRARSVDPLSNDSGNLKNSFAPKCNNILQQGLQSIENPSNDLRLNLRKKVSALRFPDSKKPLKLSSPSQFKSVIPKDGGYKYIQSPFDKYDFNKNSTQVQAKVQTTVSKNGVMVKEWDQTIFYSNEEYEYYLKKIERLSQIEFFKNFLQIKCFKRWKIHVFSQRFLITRSIIKEKLYRIYPRELLEIRKIFDKITNYKFIMLCRESPLEYDKYLVFLHDSSYPVLKRITEEHYLQVIDLMLGPIKEKVLSMEALSQKHQKIIQKHKKPYKLTKKANIMHLASLTSSESETTDILHNFQRTFQFKNEFLYIQGFIKRIFYNFTSCHIEWTINIYKEIITKLRTPLTNYKKFRDKIHGNLNNLFNMKNREQYRYEKMESYEMQIRLIEYTCEFIEDGDRLVREERDDEISNGSSSLKKQRKLFISLVQAEILGLFEQFASHLISRLSPSNILTYYKNHYIVQHRMGKAQSILPPQQQVQIQILEMIIEKIDVYTSSNIINSTPQMRYDENFRQQLQQIVVSNIQEANQIVDILNTLITDVMDFFHSQDRKQSYILSYTIMQETRQKISLIPDDIQVGLFVINILQVKNYLKDFINHELQQLTKDLPDQFRATYNSFYQKLINFTSKINLSVWTIQDFVTSFQHKEMYEEYREEQIYKDQEKIKNILSAVSKTLPKTYEECYVLFLKLKDLIQKIQTKVQTFDLNCIKKLKFFGNQIEDLAESIWRQLVKVRSMILEVDNYVERENFIEEILVELPKFQADLKKIKKSIERLSYIETLQIRFNLKEKLTKDFNLYEKSESDLKLLQSLLRKLLIFQKSYNQELLQSITVVNAESLLQEINTNKSEIKISERYIVSYQKILMKIYELYDYYKIVLETADELGRLEKEEIIEIIKWVIVQNQSKEDGIQINMNSKPNNKIMGSNQIGSSLKESTFSTKDPTNTANSSLNSNQLYNIMNSLSMLFKKDSALTLQETINLKLYKKYDEIHYEILKKEKKKKMELIIKNIETNMNDIILEVCNLEKSPFGNATEVSLSSMALIGGRNSETKSSVEEGEDKKPSATNRVNSIVPQEGGQSIAVKQNKQKQQHELNLHSGFVNLKQSIKIIQEILNELKNIILSPFLEDEKNLLLQKIQYVTSNLDILNLLLSAQSKVQKLIQDNILTDAMKEIEKDWSSHHNLFESRLGKNSKEITFDNKLQKDVINAWYFLLRRLSNKKVSQISLCFKEQSNDLENFMARLNSFEKIVNIKIQEKKTIFPLLYFFTNSEILKFVINPEIFVSHMFPCLKFERKEKKKYALTTIYGQEVDIDLQQEPTLTIKSIYEEIKAVIAEMFRENIGQHPIDLINNYTKEKTPLQIIFVLDQLYLQSKYITGMSIVTSVNTREQAISNLMGEIKVLSKTMNDPVEIQSFQYKNMLAEMLICCRIDYRNRIEINFIENYWLQELLVYHLDSYNVLYFKNLNHLLEIKYFLVNAIHLISLFPGSEKTFVKMCEAFSGEISAIHVRELQMLKSLSAKLMYPFIEYDFENKVPQDVCRGIVWNYPLCFLAKFESIGYEVLSKLIRCVEKVRYELLKERNQKGTSIQSSYLQNSLFSISSDAACIFLIFEKSPENQLIPHKLKAMFRSLTRVTPSYELVFLSKLLRADLDSSNPQLLDCLYIVNGYFYLYRQLLGHNPSFTFVNQILSKLAKELIGKKELQYRQTVQEFLVEYFVNLGLDKSSIESFLPKAKSLEQSKMGLSMRENRGAKSINKKFEMVFKFLVDAQKKEPSITSTFSGPSSYSDPLGKPWISTYELKDKIDSYIESFRDNSNGSIPDTILNILGEVIKIAVGSMNKPQRTKPIFIFGEYRTGKTLVIKLLSQFLNKVFAKGDINVDILHESEIPKHFNKIKEIFKRMAMLKHILEGNNTQKAKNSFLFLEVSSLSNENGFLETFLNMFDDQTSPKEMRKEAKISQKNKKSETIYALQIKNIVTISPSIFLNTYKFYMPETLSFIESITKKWSKDFMTKYDIKEKDDMYYSVLNSHHTGFRMVMSVFDSIGYGNANGIDWLVQPVVENVITTVLKFLDAFLMEVTNVEILFKSEEAEPEKSTKNLAIGSSTALPLMSNEQPKQKEQQFLKMIAYCTFWALALFSQQISYQQIQKIVRQHYYRVTPETIKTKDNFLYKILVIENNQINYNFLKCLNGEFDLGEEVNFRYCGSSGSLIVENLSMKVFNMFCGKLQQVGFHNKTGNNILVIGRQEVGKSTYLKNYLIEGSDSIYIRVKSHDPFAMEKFMRELTDSRHKKPKVSRYPGRDIESIMTRRPVISTQASQDNILVWIENVAFYQQTSQIQKYMKFLSQHKQYRCRNTQGDTYYTNKPLKNFMYFTERRYAEKDFLYENWNLTVVGVSFLEQELESIFTHSISKKLDQYIFDPIVMDDLKTKITIMINHHLTLLKFCRENTKPSLNNWTIDIGYSKYRYVTEEFFSQRKFSFLTGLNAEEIIKRLNLNLFFTLFCCMRNKKDLEMFENRVSKFLDLDYKEVETYLMDDEGDINSKNKNPNQSNLNNGNDLTIDESNNGLAKLSLKLKDNRLFMNILVHPTFCKNFQIVSFALKNKKHLMINKKFISRDFSFIEMVLETQGKDWGKLDLVKSYDQLKESISKLAQNVVVNEDHEGEKKGKEEEKKTSQQQNTLGKREFYLYAPYEIIKLNPLILDYVVEYIEQRKMAQQQEEQVPSSHLINSSSIKKKATKEQLLKQQAPVNKNLILSSPSVIFIIEYSLFELSLINNYLLTNLSKICTVLRLTPPSLIEYEDVGYDILVKKFPDQQNEMLKNMAKTLHVVFSQIYNMPLNDISYEKTRFVQEYNYNIKNYGQFVRIVSEVYFQRLRFAELKKNSLELTLSQIDKLVREYKTLKKDEAVCTSSKKNALINIDTTAVWLKSAKKKVDHMRVYSVEQGIYKYKDNIQAITDEINKLIQNERKLTRMSKHLISLISRNQLAEMKYIFVNNFVSMKVLFECICLVLGDGTDYGSMKKCFTDLNLVNRLKEVELEKIKFQTMLQIKEKINQMTNQNKSYSTISNKTVFQWLRCSVDLIIVRNDMDNRLPKLQKQKEELEIQLHRLIETNQMDSLEQEIQEKQLQLVKDKQTLKEIEEKLSGINELLIEMDKFDEFFQLKKHCEEQNKALSEIVKDFMYYAILDGVELVYFNIFGQQQKKKIRSNFSNFLKRKFGFISSRQKQEIFDKFEQGHTNYQDKEESIPSSLQAPPILELKYDYSMEITKSMQYINKILSKNKETLMIIDPYHTFANAIKLRSDILIVGLKTFFSKKFNYSEYKVLVIELEDDEWNVSLKELAKNSKNERKILEYQKKRIMLPSQLNVIFIKRSFCSTMVVGKRQSEQKEAGQVKKQHHPSGSNQASAQKWSNTSSTTTPQPFTQLMFAFRIFSFQLSQSDYYLLIKMIIIEQLIKAKEHSSLQMIINKQQIIRKSFMGVLYFFCKKTNQFSIKNVKLIRQAISMIQMWKITMIQTRGFQYEVFEEKHQKEEVKKIYRILSKMFKLVEMYFSRDNRYLNFDYFVSTLTRGAIYGIYNFGDQKYFILQYVISMIVYSLDSKNQFLSMFFMKIYSIQENICTQMESDNLTFVMSQFDKLEGFVVEKIQKGTYNYFKHLPYQNKHLENCYNKILGAQKIANNVLSYEQINEIIESFENLSFFKKLVIKRILAPPIFQQQMIESINILSDIIIKNNDNFIKKFFRNGLLFCQCDIYFWKKNIKLKYKYEEAVLSEVCKIRIKKGEKVNILVVDDLEGDREQAHHGEKGNAADRRDQLIKELIEMEHENSIFFSHLPMKEEFSKHFKSIPFLLFLELYCFVNIDSHDKDSLLQEKKVRSSLAKNIDGNDFVVRDFGEGGNTTSRDRQKTPRTGVRQNSSQLPVNNEGAIQAQISQSPPTIPNQQNNSKIFTNKEIKRHYYSMISQKSTEQRSIAIIRFSNHIPFLLKNQKNEAKILTYYYWKFLIWYEYEHKIVFESIKEKILKKNNELANKLEHYQENKEILKAINILAPEKIRSENQEILRIFKEYYAVLSTYITRQPVIDAYESDTQRNVFVNQSTSYEKNIQSMLSNIKEVSNILIGKISLDPQRVSDYFHKKAMYSLTEINENLVKLSKHREQVNEQNTLTHLNIELIREPSNIVALFSKPAYKIVVLGKHGAKDMSKNVLTRDEIAMNDPSARTFDEFFDSKEEQEEKPQIEEIPEVDQLKQGEPTNSKKVVEEQRKSSRKSIENQKHPNKSKNELKLNPKVQKSKEGHLKLNQRPSNSKLEKSTETLGESKLSKNSNHPLLKKTQSKTSNEGEKKIEKRLSIEVQKPKEGGQKVDSQEPNKEDLFNKIFGKIVEAQKQQQQQASNPTPSSIANINTVRKRKNNKGITLHKIYIYNQYRILFKPIEKKDIDKLSLATMFRLNLFNGFDVKLFYQKEQAVTSNNITTYGSFPMESTMELSSKHNVFNQFFGKGDKVESKIIRNQRTKKTFSPMMTKETKPEDNVILEEKSGGGQSFVKIGSDMDLGIEDNNNEVKSNSSRLLSQGNLLLQQSQEFKGETIRKGIMNSGKFMSQLKDKKTSEPLKLKITSSKKLDLGTSISPPTIGTGFDTSISNEAEHNKPEQKNKQER